jgi:hypothetical protein
MAYGGLVVAPRATRAPLLRQVCDDGYGARMDVEPRGYLIVSPEAVPLVAAALEGDGVRASMETDDWRRAVAWLRARTSYVACRFEGDGHHYWVGAGPSPTPDELPPLDDRVLGHIDCWLTEARRLHHQVAQLRSSQPDAAGPEEVAPPTAAPAGARWVTYAPASEDPRAAGASARIVTPEPHRLAGWWAAATSLVHRGPRGAAAATLSLDDRDSGPWIHFIRGEATGEVEEVDGVSDDLDRAVLELTDLGGEVRELTAEVVQVEGPEGHVARLRAAAAPIPPPIWIR